MTFIEEFAQEFVAVYNSKNEKEICHKARILVGEINKDEYQFTRTTHPYAMATALYHLLSDEAKLTDEESIPVAKLLYYCLLKNYLINNDMDISDVKYADLIDGCQLGIIFMTKFMKFIAFSIISGIAHYMPDGARKHLGNQLLLFCKTVQHVETMHFHHFIGDELMEEYKELAQELNQYLPKVADLSILKCECTPIIEQICKDIEFDCALRGNEF